MLVIHAVHPCQSSMQVIHTSHPWGPEQLLFSNQFLNLKHWLTLWHQFAAISLYCNYYCLWSLERQHWYEYFCPFLKPLVSWLIAISDICTPLFDSTQPQLFLIFPEVSLARTKMSVFQRKQAKRLKSRERRPEVERFDGQYEKFWDGHLRW